MKVHATATVGLPWYSVGVKIKAEPVQEINGSKPSARDTGVSYHHCSDSRQPSFYVSTVRYSVSPVQEEGHLARVHQSKPKASQCTPGTYSQRPVS